MDFLSRAVEHGLISLVGWLTGAIVGGGLGYGCARLIRFAYSSFPALRTLSILLPWRTVLMVLLLLVSPVFVPVLAILFGIGATTGMISVGLTILLLTLLVTATLLLEGWFPSPPVVRLVSVARTLAAGSVVLTTSVGLLGGGGVGFKISQSLNLLRYDMLLRWGLTVVVVILIFDLALGILQLLIYGVLVRQNHLQNTADR
jgi:hypothetical protein